MVPGRGNSMCESLVERAEQNWETVRSFMSLEWVTIKESLVTQCLMRGQMSTFVDIREL